MNFWDGVLISSMFWFIFCVVCLARGYICGYNDCEDMTGWSDGWNSGWESAMECMREKENKNESI